MFPIRLALPAAAIFGTVYAATCSRSATLTITNSADTASLATCETYTGSIAIATAVPAVTLDGPKRITGNLIVNSNGTLGSLEAADLRIIDGTFSLQNLDNLGSVSMPELTQVKQLKFAALGQNFLSLGFTSGLKQVDDLSIADTFLQSLTGIELDTAGTFEVVSNALLSNLTMSLRNTTGGLSIRGNKAGLAVVLNNLKSTGDLNINNCASVQLNSLVNVTGIASFYGNNFKTLSLPNLTNTNGFTLNNSEVGNFSVPKLQNTESLNIALVPQLDGALNFPSLAIIRGATFINGSFSSVSMPKLNRVQGVFQVGSTEDISDSCNTFASATNVFSITPTCVPNEGQNSGSGSPTASGSGGNGGSTKSPNAALLYGAPENPWGIFGALAAVIGLLM